MPIILTILACAAVVFARLFCPHVVPTFWGSYEALAHVLCGILVGAWLVGKRRFYLVAVVLITVFEALAFFFLK